MRTIAKTPQLCYAVSHAEKSLKFVWSNGERVIVRCASRDDLLKVKNAVNATLRTRVARDLRPGH